MGTSQSVHMANKSGQNIYVFVGLNPHWALLNFFLDITLMVIGANDIRSIALTVADYQNYKVPTKLETLRDLFEYTAVAGVMLTTGANIPNVFSAAQGFIDSVRKTAILVSKGAFKNINQQNILQIYLNPSGYAGLLGAKTVSVYVMSTDGKQVALYNTAPDHSWIATAQQTIVRAKYGSIWQQEPSSGSYAWPITTSDTAMKILQTSAMSDSVVDATDDAEGDVDSNVDVASGAAGGVDGKADEVATETVLDEVDSVAADGASG